jgi:hypothetical protein
MPKGSGRITLLILIRGRFLITTIAFFVSSISAWAQTVTSQNIDLACAVGATEEMISAPEGSKTQNTFYGLTIFYLGRLSGRDDHTDWRTVLMKSLEGHRGRRPESFMDKCFEIFRSKVGPH